MMPIRRSLRHTARQGTCSPSPGIVSTNLAGMAELFETSSAAPLTERLRTRQSTAWPADLIVPAFAVGGRAVLRLSAIRSGCAEIPEESIMHRAGRRAAPIAETSIVKRHADAFVFAPD